MFINGKLESAQIEETTTASLPAASAYPYRIFFLTDTNKTVISNGTAWISYAGGNLYIHSWQINGDFKNLVAPFVFDGARPVLNASDIVDLYGSCTIANTGTLTSVELDVETVSNNGSTISSILTTTMLLARSGSAPAKLISVDSLGQYPGGTSIPPVLASSSLPAATHLQVKVSSISFSNPTSELSDLTVSMILREQ